MNSNNFKLLKNFYKNKKVLITGHSGFKGRWLVLILEKLGAKVIGVSKNDNNKKLLKYFTTNTVDYFFDIKSPKLKNIIKIKNPDYIFHLAAQPIVSKAFKNPKDTYATNIMGTLNVLASSKFAKNLKEIIIVTTDKCYEPSAKKVFYKEDDKLGGLEPYSASKACAEIVSKSFSLTYLNKINVSTVRAGNVIGGCDFSKNRIVTDIYKSLILKKSINIRNPNHIRPWIYVFDVLFGYLSIPLNNKSKKIKNNFTSLNFGPNKKNIKDVISLVKEFKKYLKIEYKIKKDFDIYEDKYIFLNSNKALQNNWKIKFNFKKMINETSKWYLDYNKGKLSIKNNIKYLNNYLK